MHLDSLIFRIIEIETAVTQPAHSSEVSFQGVLNEICKPPRARSPPPRNPVEYDSDSDEAANYEEEAEMGEGGLDLTRYPSGSARPPRKSPEPDLDPSDVEESSSDDEDYNWDPAFLRDLVKEDSLRELVKTDDDEELKKTYHDISNCPCHGGKGETVSKAWELPSQEGGKEGARYGVVQVLTALVA